MAFDHFVDIVGALKEEMDRPVAYEDQRAQLSKLQEEQEEARSSEGTTRRLIETLWRSIDEGSTVTSHQLQMRGARDGSDAWRETLYFHVTYNINTAPRYIDIPVAHRYGATVENQGVFTPADAELVSEQLFAIEALQLSGRLPSLSKDLGHITKQLKPQAPHN